MGTATRVGNRMSTEPKDIDHETEPLLQALKEDLPALVALLEEAFFHAKTFLGLAVRYAKALDHAPRLLPSGWAAVLYLYNAR